MVELANDGSYYTINTAGAFKTSYGRNREIVYDRHTTVKQPAEVAVESQKPTQNGTSDNSRMNSSAQSDRKVTNSASDRQGEVTESSDGYTITPTSKRHQGAGRT